MIRFRIKELLDERGIKKARIKPFVQLGISHKVMQTYLSGKRKKMDDDHMEIFCFYFRCNVDNLIEWVPDKKLPIDEHHPLHQLKKRKPFSLMDAVSKLTPEEIRKKFEE